MHAALVFALVFGDTEPRAQSSAARARGCALMDSASSELFARGGLVRCSTGLV